MDKAQKYTDKALAQIEKLKEQEKDRKHPGKPSLLLSSFHALLLEHVVQCRLVTGSKAGAAEELGKLCR